MAKGYYQSIESFALVDGPGVRSVLFLTGCPFRCLFCHNPDTWVMDEKYVITPEEALKKLIRFKPYWKDHGGVTISGGEPLVQMDFLIEFARLLKANNIHVTIDTSGATFSLDESYLKKFDELLSVIDLILLDIKCIDPEIHQRLTGKDNKNVLEMFKYLDEKKFPIWVRHVLVPTITDDDELLKRTDAFLSQFSNIERVEVLPYHTLGIHKYQILGIPYPLEGVPSPSKEREENANRLLRTASYTKYLSNK